MLIAMAHMDSKNLIGIDGALAYRDPIDFKLFKTMTDGEIVWVGPNTYKEMGNLPKRVVKVLSGDLKLPENAQGVLAGGGKVYKVNLHRCDQVFISRTKLPETELGFPWMEANPTFFPAEELDTHFYLAEEIEGQTFNLEIYNHNDRIYQIPTKFYQQLINR